MVWVQACRADEVEPGDTYAAPTEPPIALYNVDGEFFATQDVCSHAESALSEGYLEGDTIECAWHMGRFCVRTGKALSLPATTDLATYPTRVVDGVVYVEVDADVDAGETVSSPS